MAEFELLEWIGVNHYMRDDYRLLVAAMAARKSSRWMRNCRGLAREAFGGIAVPGARSFFRADLVGQRKALGKAMQSDARVAAIVIALWAHAAEGQINLVKQAGRWRGLEFEEGWDWKQGMEGFFDFEEIPVLYVCGGVGEHASAQDADHLKLGALWLGPGSCNREKLNEGRRRRKREGKRE